MKILEYIFLMGALMCVVTLLRHLPTEEEIRQRHNKQEENNENGTDTDI